jgi:hypothetical protein
MGQRVSLNQESLANFAELPGIGKILIFLNRFTSTPCVIFQKVGTPEALKLALTQTKEPQ